MAKAKATVMMMNGCSDHFIYALFADEQAVSEYLERCVHHEDGIAYPDCGWARCDKILDIGTKVITKTAVRANCGPESRHFDFGCNDDYFFVDEEGRIDINSAMTIGKAHNRLINSPPVLSFEYGETQEANMAAQLKDGVSAAIDSWPCWYETRTGKAILAARLADIKKEMVEAGWRNVSRLDESDLKKMGFKIAEAQYIGGVKKTGRFISVVYEKQ